MEMQGLTNFQKELLSIAEKNLPKESAQIMRKMGSKARTLTARNARRAVKKDTGLYHSKWKRGKVFKGDNGEWVVRVYNSSPHAHLIEDGHRIVTKSGEEKGFKKGEKVLEKSMNEFNDGEMDAMLSDWLDDLLESGKL